MNKSLEQLLDFRTPLKGLARGIALGSILGGPVGLLAEALEPVAGKNYVIDIYPEKSEHAYYRIRPEKRMIASVVYGQVLFSGVGGLAGVMTGALMERKRRAGRKYFKR